MNEDKLRRVLGRMLDPNEFLSDYGIRSISKAYEGKPFVFDYAGGQKFGRVSAGRVEYRNVRRQLQLARTDLDACEYA